MLKWILAACVTTHAFAHTGELLYKLKSSKSDWGIDTLRPAGKQSVSELRREMLASGRYEFVELNTHESLPLELPGERTDVSNQWHHETIHSLQAWNLSNTNNQIIVAVCDSGVKFDHEDLLGQILPGRNLIDDVNDNSITTQHGTFVAGLIAANANTFGVAGVAPSVKVLPLRISDSNGGTSMDLILKCIRHAVDAGARVINVSFTGVNHPGVQAAGLYANEKGALLVYAAGNQGFFRSSKTYPDYKNVLVVGATSEDDRRWTWFIDPKNKGGSNYGLFIDLMAPGHAMYSTTLDDPLTPEIESYRTGSGTSYATPLVSGVAALLFSVNPSFTPKQVERFIMKSADSMGSPGYYGAGRLNAARALELARKDLTYVETR